MRIAFVIQDLIGQGVEYATATMIRAFLKKGWKVDLLVSPVHDDKVSAGGQSFELPRVVNWIRMPDRRGSRNGLFLRKYLLSGVPDIVLAESGIYSWCLVWASFGLPRHRLPKLAQVIHGNLFPREGMDLIWGKLRNWYHYRKFSALMFVNDESTQNFNLMYGALLPRLRVGTVNNACVDKVFREKVSRPPEHPWLCEKICPTFVTAGSYTRGKCHLMLLEAAQLASMRRKFRLIIFGQGPLAPLYREFISQHHLEDVVSIGNFTDQLPAEMNAADCVVSSSDSESFGITIVEALACRKPVISTDAPMGPREILSGGKYGRLVPVNDPVAMSDALVDGVDGKIPVAPDESWRRYMVENVSRRYFEFLDLPD